MHPDNSRIRTNVVLALIVCAAALGARADSLRLTLQPDDLGPFQPGVGGFIDLTVAMELLDSEGDGADTQGMAGAVFDLLTDTGLPIPAFLPAQTGESGVHGPADIRDPRYWPSETTTEPLFEGGYGIDAPNPFYGFPDGDDRLSIGSHMGFWEADVQPNAPGLQPAALAGIGYGERPAGGDWLFATGQIPIPTQPGLYMVELDLYAGAFIHPDVDLSIDSPPGWFQGFDAENLIGDSFGFTVLPEPGTILLSVIGATLAIPRRRRTD